MTTTITTTITIPSCRVLLLLLLLLLLVWIRHPKILSWMIVRSTMRIYLWCWSTMKNRTNTLATTVQILLLRRNNIIVRLPWMICCHYYRHRYFLFTIIPVAAAAAAAAVPIWVVRLYRRPIVPWRQPPPRRITEHIVGWNRWYINIKRRRIATHRTEHVYYHHCI